MVSVVGRQACGGSSLSGISPRIQMASCESTPAVIVTVVYKPHSLPGSLVPKKWRPTVPTLLLNLDSKSTTFGLTLTAGRWPCGGAWEGSPLMITLSCATQPLKLISPEFEACFCSPSPKHKFPMTPSHPPSSRDSKRLTGVLKLKDLHATSGRMCSNVETAACPD